MSAGIDGADERRAKARAAVIARLAGLLLPRARRKPEPPAPPPASPFVEVPTPAPPDGWACVEALPVMPAPVPVGLGSWRSNCSAINPDTGRRCCLLAGHAHAHRHGRTEFATAAAPGTTHFPRAERLAEAAGARHGVDPRSF